MKISPICYFPKANIKIQKSSIALNYRKNELKNDAVSFKGKVIINPAWDEFESEFNEAHKDESVNDVLLSSIQNPKNRLGEGVKKVVYLIDGVDDFVVARMKNEDFNPQKPCVPCVDKLPQCNVGQAVGRNQAGFFIMKKITGQSHGISDWSSLYTGFVYENRAITKQEAETFLAQLRDINGLSFEAYIDLAKQIKYLADKKIKIDMINPNNLMVDCKNNKMTYFDLFEKPEVFYHILPEINSVQDMAYLIIDPLLQSEYLKALDSEKKEEMIALVQEIMLKVKHAGKIAGLVDDEHIVSTTYALLQGRLMVKNNERNPRYLEQYNEFRKIYRDII